VKRLSCKEIGCRWAAGVVASALMLVGCSAATDDDGEAQAVGTLAAAPARLPSATPVVVDTDLGADDLVALALLLRHPQVRVEAITVAATGLVGCPQAVDVVADLTAALATSAPVVACGRARPGPAGRPMPDTWRARAAQGNGLPRASALARHLFPVEVSPRPAVELLARIAGEYPGLTVVALGPLTNVADLAASHPKAFASLQSVHAMGGVVAAPGENGIGEWNVAADPDSFAAVLDTARQGPGPRLTIVPLDAVPLGTPSALTGPVVGSVSAQAALPAWWDAATAVAVVEPGAAAVRTGTFTLDASEPGRLRRIGEGPVRVVDGLDPAVLDRVYASVFAADPA
jgi:Inosine-uridine preferring nucleoside hydrolase